MKLAAAPRDGSSSNSVTLLPFYRLSSPIALSKTSPYKCVYVDVSK